MTRSQRILLFFAFLLLAGWLGYDMFRVNAAGQLWGHRPLFLFVSLWGAVILFFKTFQRFSKKWRWLGLSTLSGILLSIGFPDIGIPFPIFMFLGFVPLLIVEHEIAQSSAEISKREVFKFSYATFVLWNILTTFWVANTAFVAGVLAITVNALFMAVPFVAFHATKKRLPHLGHAAFVSYWLAFEYVHLRWELRWPWLTLGNSFAGYPSWVQWYEFTGVFGGGIWILLANVLVFKIIQRRYFKKNSIPISNWISLASLILLPLLISFWMYSQHEEQGEKVEVVVIQPNYEPHYDKFRIPAQEQLRRFLQLSKETVTDSTDYLIFPETSFRQINIRALLNNAPIRQLQRFVNDYPELNLVAGLSSYKFYEPGEEFSPAVRKLDRGRGEIVYWESYNSAIQLQKGADKIPVYFKSKLVPGAEFLPYRRVFSFLEPLVEKLDGSLAGLGMQEERAVFSDEGKQIAPVICYESIYGEYETGYIKKGAQAIFIMTNDGWWDKTAGHRQHLHFASLRAIETRRAIARSANTGVSAFLNQRGDILQPTEYGETTAIRGEIQLNNSITFYVKWGDLIGRLAVLLAIILLLNTLVKRLRAKV